MLLNGRSVFGEEIQELGRRSAAGDWSEGKRGAVSDADVLDAYVDRLVEDFDGKPFRIGWDAGNGAAGPALEKLVATPPGEHHAIFTEVDGTFPNHHPDPTVEANLADLKRWSPTRTSTSASPSTATATASARSTARAG